MSRFLDGVELETDCSGVDVEICDNCMRTAELESESVLRRATVVARQETVDSKAIPLIWQQMLLLLGIGWRVRSQHSAIPLCHDVSHGPLARCSMTSRVMLHD